MTTIAEDLFAEALRLPEGARAALAAALINRLDTDADARWAIEIHRRIAARDAGAPTTPWDEARKLIAAG